MKSLALRSVLFVPGDRARMLEKARSVGADAVILDLEDGVAPENKPVARTMVADALKTAGFEPYVAVRVNGFATGLAEQDLDAIVGPEVRAVCLPKSESVEEVLRLANLLDGIERRWGMRPGSTSIMLLVETARGILNSRELATASARVVALCLGGEDLCWDLGAVRSKQGWELGHARGRLVLSARAAGVHALDTVWTDLRDEAGLAGESRRARQMGFSGKLLIHPSQIEPVTIAFTPNQAEIEHARRIVTAFQEATARGQGVVTVDGKMIDAPVVARAREVLACVGEAP
jgi:citrate lyase subunit beta/citryl-CoA lyase